MSTDMLAAAASLSNSDLLARLPLLAQRGRENTVELVAHLAELEVRRLYLGEGHGSLFDYCTTALRLSEHEAYNRKVAARVAREFPVVLEGLANGSLNLTTVRLLAPHLDPDNHRDVLARAAGRSKREVEALVASLAPQPDVDPSVRRLPEPVRTPSDSPAQVPMSMLKATPATVDPMGSEPVIPARPTAQPTAQPAAADTGTASGHVQGRSPGQYNVQPLSPGRYRVQFTVGAETYDELRLAQDLLRREIPTGDPGAIFARALKLLVVQVAKEKTAAASRPRSVRPTASGSRHIPAAVKRAVWLRDRGQCAFMAQVGRRCTERAFLEFHHIQPFAIGGEATVGNISLRCRQHNVHEAVLAFGT